MSVIRSSIPTKLEKYTDRTSPMSSIAIPSFEQMPSVVIKQAPSPYARIQTNSYRLSHDPPL